MRSSTCLFIALCVLGATCGGLKASAYRFMSSPGAARPQGPLPGVRDARVTEIPGVVSAGAVWTLVWQGSDNADGLLQEMTTPAGVRNNAKSIYRMTVLAQGFKGRAK